MQVSPANAGFLDVGAEVFGQSLGEGGDQHAFAAGGAFPDLSEQMRHLARARDGRRSPGQPVPSGG